MSIDNVINNFVKALETKGRSPSTVVAYRKDLDQLKEYLNKSNIDINDARNVDLEGFVNTLIEDEAYTLKTVSRKINTIKTFYKFLVENKSIAENYAESIEHPDFENRKSRILIMIEYKALRDTARYSLRLYTIVELLLQTGMRIGELSRLTLKDINLNKNTISISEYASNPSRTIEVNEVALECLKEWISKRPKVMNDKGFLFPTKTGKPLLVRNIRTSINRSFKKVGIKDATVNDIRNTFIHFQLQSGVRIERVAEYVGHQRLSSTEKYLELLNEPYKARTIKIFTL